MQQNKHSGNKEGSYDTTHISFPHKAYQQKTQAGKIITRVLRGQTQQAHTLDSH